MQERNEFWKGVTVGLLGGLAIGVLTRLAVARSLVIESHLAAPRKPQRKVSIPTPAKGIPSATRPVTTISPREFVSKREAAESAGDPRVTSPGSHSSLADAEGKAFERPPGAPGGQTPAERLEAPGRPGKHMDEAPPTPNGPAPKRPRSNRVPK